MIRYPEALTALDAAIEAEAAGWLVRARERTDIFRQQKGYLEEYTDPSTGSVRTLSPFWSEIKPVYMKRQHRKCIYCEKRLEGRNFATIEWDL